MLDVIFVNQVVLIQDMNSFEEERKESSPSGQHFNTAFASEINKRINKPMPTTSNIAPPPPNKHIGLAIHQMDQKIQQIR